MSKPELATFLQKVVRTVHAHKNRGDRLLAEHALMWLCVAQRPLRTHEIVNALETYYYYRVHGWQQLLEWYLDERKLADLKGAGAGDVAAGRYLQTLLPILCAVTNDPEDCDTRYANLDYPGRGAGFSEAAPPVVLPNSKKARLAFGSHWVEQAHHLVAIDCMKICSEGTLHAGHVLKNAEASPLLPYAWSHWVTHLSLAGNVAHCGMVEWFGNSMIWGVAKDTLVLLLTINDFLVNPIRARGTASRIGALALIQQAQKDLERPLVLLSTLARKEPHFDIVISARKAAMHSLDPEATGSQTTPNLSAASGTVGRTAEANPDSTSSIENRSTPKPCSTLPMTDTVCLGPSVLPHTRQITDEEQERKNREAAEIAEEEAALESLKEKKTMRKSGKLLRKDQTQFERLEASLERRYAERAAREAAETVSQAPAAEPAPELEPESQPVSAAPSDDEEQLRPAAGEQGCSGLPTSTRRLLTMEQKHIIRSFAEVAQGLRVVCLSLSSPILYDELLRHVDGACSPMHVLAQTAMLMDKMGDYASGEDLRAHGQPDVQEPFVVSDPTDKNYLKAGLVRHYLSNHQKRSACCCCEIVRTTSTDFNKPAGISTTRWCAALAVEKLKRLTRLDCNAAGTVTINDHLLGQRTSSFTSFPSHLYMPPSDQLRYIASCTPQSVRQFVRSRTAWLFNWTSSLDLVAVFCVFSPGAFTLGDAPRRTQLKSAILASGYRVALVHGTFAILLNHLRRFFIPWLGAFLFHHPMEDLRLALSNPDMFLQHTLSYTWTGACFAFLQRWAFDVVALVVMRLVVLNNGRPPIDMLARPNTNQDEIMHLAMIFCWVYGFATFEYIFSRSLHAVNLLIALSTLVTGGEHAHLALLSLIQAHWTHIPLLVVLTRYYLRHAFSPVIQGSISSAVRGRPGLLLTLAAVAGGVVATLRLRSKLGFLWLELSNLFLILGLLVGVISLLGYEFVRDPLGLEGSTAWAKRCGVEARKALPDGAEEKLETMRNTMNATREGVNAKKMD